MRAALYVRLSEETETTTSPARQEAIGRAYAEQRGWTVVHVYPDIDVSASKTGLDRPELTKLREAVQLHAIDVVIVWRLDRLARSVLDTLTILKEFTDAGCATASATENIDLTTPIGKAMVALIAIFAEMEADAIKARVRSSIDALRRDGRFAGGTVPYGYVPVPNPDGPGRVLAVDEQEAAIIREAVEMVRSGHSLGRVCRLLNERGVWAPRSEARRLLRAGRDITEADRGVWRTQSLRRLLTSHHLCGRAMHRDQLIRDEHGLPAAVWPPIIDGAVLAHLRDLLEPDGAPRERRVRQARLLSGLAVCASCGSKLYVSTTSGRSHYFCSSRRNGGACASPRIGADVFERYVMSQALDVLGSRPLTRTVAVADPAAEARGISFHEVEREIAATTAAMQADDADVADLLARLKALKAKRAELRADDRPPVFYVVEETGETWGEAFSVADTEQQRLLLEQEIAAVRVYPTTAGKRIVDATRVVIDWTPDEVAVG